MFIRKLVDATAALALGLFALTSIALAQPGGQDPNQPPTGETPTVGQRPDLEIQDGTPGDARGLAREEMWKAPTDEDWQKPVLIQWQRTWEDAVAVSRETGKPILVCVNMDGEIASEHYAGIRYRQPEIAALYEPYVCVIASTYRHNEQDHDAEGHRLECPRFGGVTCAEHIEIEPFLYEKFFEGERVAPRHIMVELDGEETFDIYYAFDTVSVFQTIRDGISQRAVQAEPVVRGDRTIVERVASRDATDRDAVEKAYAEGDRATREALLQAALQHPDAAPYELLRQAVFGLDLELAEKARRALAQADEASAVDVIAEALQVPMSDEEKGALVDTLGRLGSVSRRAKRLNVVYRGLDGGPGAAVDAAAYVDGIRGATYPAPPGFDTVEDRLRRSEGAVRSRPADAQAWLAYARNLLAYCESNETRNRLAPDPRVRDAILEEEYRKALEAGQQAEKLGAEGWLVDGVIGLSAFRCQDTATGYERAAKSVKAIPPGDGSLESMALLGLYADSLRQTISTAVRNREDWAPELMADLHATYTVLAQHPRGEAGQIAAHFDFLWALDAREKAKSALTVGLQRFSADPSLHQRLRRVVLREQGADGLARMYDRLLAESPENNDLLWFAAYADQTRADSLRRRGRREVAVEAYVKAEARWEKFCERAPQQRDSADHYVALALAARGRLAFEAQDLDASARLMLASIERRRDSAAILDGLNLSPVDTAKQIRTACREAGRDDLAQKITDVFATLRPDQLELPAYERGGPRPGRRRRGN
ncbi:MAG: hypothetical protein AAF196_12430 [Planctomycetota bacterium]